MEIYLDIDKTQKFTDYEINEDGYAVIDKDISVYVFGDSKVFAKGKSKVVAEDRSVEVILKLESEAEIVLKGYNKRGG
jgi:hypothetical protein